MFGLKKEADKAKEDLTNQVKGDIKCIQGTSKIKMAAMFKEFVKETNNIKKVSSIKLSTDKKSLKKVLQGAMDDDSDASKSGDESDNDEDSNADDESKKDDDVVIELDDNFAEADSKDDPFNINHRDESTDSDDDSKDDDSDEASASSSEEDKKKKKKKHWDAKENNLCMQFLKSGMKPARAAKMASKMIREMMVILNNDESRTEVLVASFISHPHFHCILTNLATIKNPVGISCIGAERETEIWS